MDKRYIYKIYSELNLIVVYYLGDIILSDIKSMMNELTNEPDYSPYYDSINDFRDCNILINEDDVDDSLATIDIFGVNIESWCSSENTFTTNEDGTTNSEAGKSFEDNNDQNSVNGSDNDVHEAGKSVNDVDNE